jgi:hypothetical protein
MSSKIPPKTIKPPLNNNVKKEEQNDKGPVMAFERPQSASNTDKKKSIRGIPPSLTTKGTNTLDCR